MREARERGLEVTLTTAEWLALFRSDCHYCGSPPLQVVRPGKRGALRQTGVDRVDSHQDYPLENSVPARHTCNRAKAAMSVEQLRTRTERVYAHQLAQGDAEGL